MKLTVVDRSEIGHLSYKRTKLQSLFEEFIAMDTPVVRVDAHGYKHTSACYVTLTKAAKKWTNNVAVTLRGDSVYLVRKDMED